MYNNGPFVNYKDTKPPAGIDKIRLHTREFSVRDTRNIAIVPNTKKQGEEDAIPKELFRVGEGMVYGSQAYHNADNGALGNLVFEINGYGFSAHWNPSKLAGKYTGELANLSDISTSLPVVQDYLRQNGVLVNVADAKLTRLDLAKDRQMSDKVRSYATALSSLDGKRMKERVQYPDGVRIGTQSKQGIFYDKGLELSPADGSTNNMRGEFRMLKGETIKSTLGTITAGELTSLHQQDISTAYANYINADLYRMGNAEQLSFSFTTEVEVLKFYRTTFKRNALLYWFVQEGIQMKLERIGDMDTLAKIMLEAGYTRQTVYKEKRKFEKILRQATFDRNSPQTLGKKREEIRQRFVA